MRFSSNMGSGIRKTITIGILLPILLSLSTCDLFKVGLGEKVDISAPEISITSPANGAYVRGSIAVSGTVSDDLGVSEVSVVVGGQSYKAAVSGGSWSVTLPVAKAVSGGSGLAEGDTKISALAVDDSGKIRTAETEVYVDNIGPFVLITVPQSYGSAASTYTGYVDFKGETWDASPVSKVEVVVVDKTSKAELKRKTAEGTSSWSVRFTIGAGKDLELADKTAYDYYVEATDRAGNVNGYAYHSQDIYDLMDQSMTPRVKQ